ncbi:hypothetical protein HK104_002204 [Borealophlyctis nickersoniae]|nr:hypothetical protein HK104_002204 [Borealophlyctis nickersoniae]
MTRSAQYTVLVTVLEGDSRATPLLVPQDPLTEFQRVGRYFPRKPSSKTYIQCRFNNEILTTDPVDQGPTPIWDTELAWDVDTKILSFLRSQRVSLKLMCYSIDAQNRREALGYVMLDLRAAETTIPAQEKWYLLVNAKPTGAFRPEISISFAVAPKGMDVEEAPIPKPLAGRLHTREMPRTLSGGGAKKGGIGNTSSAVAPQPGPMRPGQSSHAQTNLPVELMEDGYYQIGTGDVHWLLWITIAFAENLVLLLNDPSPPSDNGYYFFYTFLGNEIVTEKFRNLNNPNFPAERVSIRLRASLNDLKTFLNDISKLIIYMCCDSQVFGFADVPLAGLLDEGSGKPPVVEKVYNLYNTKQELPMSQDAKVPNMGVSMAITREPAGTVGEEQAQQVEERLGGDEEELPKDVGKQVDWEASEQRNPPGGPSRMASSPLPTPAKRPLSPPPVSRPAHPQAELPPRAPTTKKNIPVSDPETAGMPFRWHQYRFSIDLRSVRDFQPKAASIYLKYAYPPFGTVSPIITHPPLDIMRSPHDCLLPHSFCAFEFVMSPDRLRTYLEAVPLMVEMWAKDPFAKDTLLGTATVDLSAVCGMARVLEEGGTALIQSLDQHVLVSSAGEQAGRMRKIGDLRIVLALEDFGVLEEEDVPVLPETPGQTVDPKGPPRRSAPRPRRGSRPAATYRPLAPDTAASTSSLGDTPGSAVSSIHDTAEYRVALELEVWKQEEERKFREHLRTREAELMAQLSSEWKRRERDREATMKRKIDEFKQLETQMQKLVTELEARERRLVKAEEDLCRRKEELEREGERRIEEARDAARRLHEEFRHRVEVEKQRVAESEAQRDRIAKERDETESRKRAIEAELAEVRRSIHTTPEATLRAELNAANAAKIQMERRIDALERSKKHYKAEWVRALRELAKAKKAWQSEVEDRVLKDKEEVERLRLKMMAKDELVVVDGDKQLLDGIRRELEDLKRNGFDGRASVVVPDKVVRNASLGRFGDPPVPANENKEDRGGTWAEFIGGLNRGNNGGGGDDSFDPQLLAEVERLAKEKDSLIDSGVYTREDRLIRELDRRIKELLSNRHAG